MCFHWFLRSDFPIVRIRFRVLVRMEYFGQIFFFLLIYRYMQCISVIGRALCVGNLRIRKVQLDML